jgi:predicted DNA binding CopG/RHH family protein
MKPFAWSPEKNEQLMAERALCFEAVVVAIETGELLDVLDHPNQSRYPGQRILVVRLDGYVHLVPYAESDDHLFLKTIIPMERAMPEQNPPLQLDADEQQLLDAYEQGSLKSVATPALLDGLRQSARATGQKDQRINIRLSSGDLQAIRTRALKEGIPYQTLISSVLHKYASGTLQERVAMQ